MKIIALQGMKNWKMRRQILGITRARAPEDAGTKECPLLSWRGDLAAAIDIWKTAGSNHSLPTWLAI